MKKILTLGVLSLLAFAGNAFAAGSADANFQAKATVNSECVLGAGSISFVAPGLVKPNAVLNAVGQTSIECTGQIPVSIKSSIAAQSMTGPSGSASFSLYNDATRTVNMNSTGMSFTSAGGIENVSLYGSVRNVSLSNALAPGSYTANMTQTATF